MSDGAVSATVPARAALAGNPSDGHGGAVVATVVDAVTAIVTATPHDRFEIAGTGLAYSSIGELVSRVAAEGCGEIQPLVPAALVTLYRYVGADLWPARVEVHSTIPRSVGLAGSSAIVIATMRAMTLLHRTARWSVALDDPALTASLALAAERDVLGISAGLQDRVVQAFGGTVAMDFRAASMRSILGLAAGTYRQLGTLPDGLFVAYRPETAADSGRVHAAVDPTDPLVRSAMRRAAAAASSASAAIESGDAAALGAAMDATFDQRAAVMPLDPAHVAMVEVARAYGASANYTGSGGAIIVLAPDDGARAGLEALGCEILPM